MLRKLLRKIGLIKPKKLANPEGRPPKDLDLDTIYDLKKKGVSNRQIAKQLGVSEGTIRTRIKQINSMRHIFPDTIVT